MQKKDNSKSQRRFLEEYANSLDISLSAKRAGYNQKSGAGIVTSFLSCPKNQKALYALCEEKSAYLEVCPGYIVMNYLKILKWAISEDETGKPNDAALALRALEGITKQLNREPAAKEPNKEHGIPIISQITNLDPSKI